MKKENKVLVMVWDGRSGDFGKTAIYTNMSVRQALICGVEQYKGNYNTVAYPKDLDGIYKSPMVKGRLLYDIDENISLYAQRA